MPGYRGEDQKLVVINLRVAAHEKAAWVDHVKKQGGYLSALIRNAVNSHVKDAAPKARCDHYG
jgi:hypothetical protein